jgi:hypothetical protein
MLPLLAFFGFGKKGFGHYPVEITGRTPQKQCACGCKKLTFSSTYFNLTHAVLHKQKIVDANEKLIKELKDGKF